MGLAVLYCLVAADLVLNYVLHLLALTSHLCIQLLCISTFPGVAFWDLRSLNESDGPLILIGLSVPCWDASHAVNGCCYVKMKMAVLNIQGFESDDFA